MSTPEQTQVYAQGYQVGYQHGYEAAMKALSGGGGGGGGSENYPVRLLVQRPAESSRLLMFFRWFKAILLFPHLIALWFLSIGAWVVMVISWWAVVITGTFPQSLFDYLVGVTQWQTRVSAYMLGLTDQYPPFSLQ